MLSLDLIQPMADRRIPYRGFAKRWLSKFEHFLGNGNAAGGAERFDSSEDSSGGFAGDRLIRDGFEECFVWRLKAILIHLKWDGFGDEAFEAIVVFGEVFGGCG